MLPISLSGKAYLKSILTKLDFTGPTEAVATAGQPVATVELPQKG